MAGIAEKVFNLIKPAVEEAGVYLWDVKYVKEGASYYLRVYIDSEEGISIDDCTRVSRAIDPIIDEADPIECSYCLEVCSPGIERELTRPEHFEMAIGCRVKLKLFKALDGKKDFIGTLADFDGKNITVEDTQRSVTFNQSEVAKTNILFFDE